jgi:carboxylesterase
MPDQKPPIFQHPEMDGSTFYWPGNSIGILLTHGFTATSVEVRPMAAFLHEKGYSVAGPLLPGHGHAVKDMNKVKWTDWVAAVEDQYQKLKAKCSKIFVLGESMGGLLSMEMAIVHPEIAGVMLFAPAVHVPKLGMARWIWPFKDYIYKSNTDDSMPWQGFNVVPLHAASELLKLQSHIQNHLIEIKQPTIIFQGRLDKSIDPISSVEVVEGISSDEKELFWMEESSHCILIDKQLPDTEAICLEFIQNH